LSQSGELDRRNLSAAILRANAEAESARQKLTLLRAEADGAKLLADRQRLIRNIAMLFTALLFAGALLLWWVWRRRQESERHRRVIQERSAIVGRLTAGIAHEFNNQLTVMQQGLGLLAGRPSLAADPVAAQLVGEMQKSSRTSAAITAQLQSFGRQQNLNPRSISLAQLLGHIGPAMAMAVGEKVRLEIDLGSPAPMVWADERQLSAALMNLVTNARDALPGGGTITIRAGNREGSRTTIAVIDQGTGMSPEVMSHATEPFYTTKSLGAGSGLGLSMVEGFVTQSSGWMRIHSVPGRGTTVTLDLPADGRPR